MILFWVLLVLIIVISFLLAYISMEDFPRSPEDFNKENSLFLIRNPGAFNVQSLSSLYRVLVDKGLIISLERLIKGSQAALVIYGPKAVLKPFAHSLNLLELEDYTPKATSYSAWEFGLKKAKQTPIESIFSNFPPMEGNEHVWYQMVLQAQRGNPDQFWAQVRAIVISPKMHKRDRLLRILSTKGFAKFLQPLSSQQILDLYKQRSIVEKKHFKIKSEDIAKLLSLS